MQALGRRISLFFFLVCFVSIAGSQHTIAQVRYEQSLPDGWSHQRVTTPDGQLALCVTRSSLRNGMGVFLIVNGRGESTIGIYSTRWRLNPEWAQQFSIRIDGRRVRVHEPDAKNNIFAAKLSDPSTVLPLLANGKLISTTYNDVEVAADLTGVRHGVAAVMECARRYGDARLLAALGIPGRSVAVEPPRSSSGTGFFVSAGGHILTNAHVVDNCTSITVERPGDKPVPVSLFTKDETSDLAVLGGNVAPDQTLEWRENYRLGENIFVFGYPLQGLLSSGGNFTTGTIASIQGLQGDPKSMQISAPVQPGNSGGALLDAGGNIVGVVTSKLDAAKVAEIIKDIPQNINFAVNATTAIAFLRRAGVKIAVASGIESKKPEDIAALAQAVSVLVRCIRGASVATARREVAPAPAPTISRRVKDDVSQGHLNLREGPGTHTRVLTRIPAGTSNVQQYGDCTPPKDGASRSSFCPVRWNGYTGWAALTGLE